MTFDTVYKQAVIDVLENIDCSDGTGISALKCEVVDDAITAIKALPSAQPEIIQCKDCKYQSKGQNECETWNLCGYRPWQYTPTTDEHFCSYAERRTDDADVNT